MCVVVVVEPMRLDEGEKIIKILHNRILSVIRIDKKHIYF
jgi:hypothetical protein